MVVVSIVIAPLTNPDETAVFEGYRVLSGVFPAKVAILEIGEVVTLFDRNSLVAGGPNPRRRASRHGQNPVQEQSSALLQQGRGAFWPAARVGLLTRSTHRSSRRSHKFYGEASDQ